MDPQNIPPNNPNPPVNQAPLEPLTPVNPLPSAQPVQSNDRQLAIDKLKNSTNVLITVGSSSNVDELSSALGLTLLLDKLGKHATTVFSGEVPRAIEFLDPEATFEDNVDSLRDFIIALDKEKADKLRYKVEEDVVRIFITPYKTKISEKDLDFSQGDFNIDVIIALGVVAREDLDKAITAHGRILHDATVITVNVGNQISTLGSINWNDEKASSIAEMLVSAGESFGSNLLDAQISTAYLTGIVASTNRFSNDKTSPKVMTMAAQLMAAGANQQLIASNLRQDGVLSENIQKPGQDHTKESEVVVEHNPEKTDSKQATKPAKKANSKSKAVSQDSKDESLPKTDETLPKPPDFPPKIPEAQVSKPEEESSIELPDDLKQQLEPENQSEPAAKQEPILDVKADSSAFEPTIAPAENPEITDDVPAFNATMAQTEASQKPADDTQVADMPSLPTLPQEAPVVTSQAPTVEAQPKTEAVQAQQPEVEDKDSALEEARRAVETATDSVPFNPANQPLESINAQPLPPLNNDPVSVDPVISPDNSGQESLPSVDLPPTISAVSGGDEGLPPAAGPDSSFMSGGLDEPDDSPMDSFMSAHAKPTIQPEIDFVAPQPTTSNQQPDFGAQTSNMPPPPPEPTPSADMSLPPLPPLPGQPNGVTMQPTLTPDVNPSFMQGMPSSQNPLTQAADDLAAKNQADEQNRQAKLDQMNQQYDTAVDRNRELQGLPPVNNPNGSGLPPAPDDHTTFPMPPTQ